MRKFLITLGLFATLAVASQNTECKIRFEDDNIDPRSTFVVAIKKCMILSAQNSACVTKKSAKDSTVYTLENDLLCTQVYGNGNKHQSFIVFKESDNAKTSVTVNSDESFKLSRGFGYRFIN